MDHVLGLDHCIVLVRDLDEADRTMRRLGFRPTPRGLHSTHMGTANATIMFRDGTYFETLGVVQPTPHNADTRERLARREGPFGLAFKTDDAKAAASEFAAAGIGSGEAVDFARPVELPEGMREARFTVARTKQGSTPGAWLFVCQHHTPEVVWREDHLDHPNGALGLVEVVGVGPNLPAMVDNWKKIVGARLAQDDQSLAIDSGKAAIRFLSPSEFPKRYGKVIDGPLVDEPTLAALRFAVADIDQAAALLTDNGVPFERLEGGTLAVGPAQACGTIVEFSSSGS